MPRQQEVQRVEMLKLVLPRVGVKHDGDGNREDACSGVSEL